MRGPLPLLLRGLEDRRLLGDLRKFLAGQHSLANQNWALRTMNTKMEGG